MLGVVFSNLDVIEKDKKTFCAVKEFLQKVLGLTLKPLPEKEVEITQEMQKLIDERKEARKKKDWSKADALRDQLHKLGYDVQDQKLKK